MSGVESVVDATAGLSLEAIRWPSDKELFHTILTADEKRALLKDGLIYVVYHYSRSRSARPPNLSSYYICPQPNGMELKRKWLCYSPRGKYAYCETCWLFSCLPRTPWADRI